MRFIKKHKLYVLFLLISIHLFAQKKENIDDIDLLLENLGINEYVNLAEQYNIKWIQPQHEKKFKNHFIKVRSIYMKDIKIFIQKKYKKEEIDFILKFYSSEVGKKMINKNSLYLKTVMNAQNNWAEHFEEISSNLTMGKYQTKP